jgi:transcriptional regulator with XRE-family HTH domain
MATPSSPTARRLELARRLRELREAAGKSLVDVAEELACSQAKVSRIENGQRGVQALDIRVLCRFYGVSPKVQQELTTLATEARKRGWWQDYRTLDEQTKTYIGLESAASVMRVGETLRIPGLLQTAEYTRAWVETMRPPGFWQPGDVDQIVEARQRRQQRVASGELRLSALVDEVAFRRVIPGAPRIMIDQVRRVVADASRTNVVIQVIPEAVGPHALLDGSFQLLTFSSAGLSDVVHIEGQFGSIIHEKRPDNDLVARYHGVFDHLSSAVALSADDTLIWLHRYAETLEAQASPVRSND